MATEDFGLKFDLFQEQKPGKTLDLDLIRDLGDSFIDFDIDNTTVPDISDHLFNNFDPIHFDEHSSQLDCDELLSSLNTSDCCKKHEIDLDLDNLDSGDPLRHDCMWSGLCPSEEHRNIVKKEKDPSSSSSSSTVTSVFDTPLQSDFDTSDIDENFSEASSDPDPDGDADPEPTKSPVSANIDHLYGDHCYTSSQASPPVTSIILKPSQKRGRDRVTIKTRPPVVTVNRSQARPTKAAGQAKFRFQMKFVTGEARSNSSSGLRQTGDSLLAHPSRLNRTHYHKRKAAIKNSFCQSPKKSIQVRIYSFFDCCPNVLRILKSFYALPICCSG